MNDFTLTREDFAALMLKLNATIMSQNALSSISIALALAVCISIGASLYVCLMAYELFSLTNSHVASIAVCAAVAILATVILHFMHAKRMLLSLVSDQGWFLAPQAMKIDESGIEHQSRLGFIKFDWQGFIHQTEDSERFFLFIEPGQGFVVPKKILSDLRLQELIRTKIPREF